MRLPLPCRWLSAFCAVLASAAVTQGCNSKVDAFYARSYACNSRLPDPDCGSDRSGTALMCSQVTETLGGSDICAEVCVEGPEASSQTYACLQDGSKAQRCRPSQGASACADPELSCLRTDLERDEGLCLPLKTCTNDSECTAGRSACMTSLARLQYPNATSLRLDSLHCMTVGCSSTQTSCANGEVCVPRVIDAQNSPPDVCLPTCDPQNRCPPNHTCLRRVSRAYPPLCVPGTLARPCNTDLDCVIGQCTSLEYGYKACTRECNSDQDCMQFDVGQTYFFCASGRCVSPEALTWPDCITDDDCPDPALICARTDPANATGACRIPCAPDRSCPTRAGIVHGCMEWSGVNVCHPGIFGRYPCTGDQDCMRGLRCLSSPSAVFSSICSVTCNDDHDCVNNRQTSIGFCLDGVCSPPLDPGKTCDRNQQCSSGTCDLKVDQCAGDG